MVVNIFYRTSDASFHGNDFLLFFDTRNDYDRFLSNGFCLHRDSPAESLFRSSFAQLITVFSSFATLCETFRFQYHDCRDTAIAAAAAAS